jgi:hypothetical protein
MRPLIETWAQDPQTTIIELRYVSHIDLLATLAHDRLARTPTRPHHNTTAAAPHTTPDSHTSSTPHRPTARILTSAPARAPSSLPPHNLIASTILHDTKPTEARYPTRPSPRYLSRTAPSTASFRAIAPHLPPPSASRHPHTRDSHQARFSTLSTRRLPSRATSQPTTHDPNHRSRPTSTTAGQRSHGRTCASSHQHATPDHRGYRSRSTATRPPAPTLRPSPRPTIIATPIDALTPNSATLFGYYTALSQQEHTREITRHTQASEPPRSALRVSIPLHVGRLPAATQSPSARTEAHSPFPAAHHHLYPVATRSHTAPRRTHATRRHCPYTPPPPPRT